MEPRSGSETAAAIAAPRKNIPAAVSTAIQIDSSKNSSGSISSSGST
eukprot:CAMPEP_0201251706 /NCGR_PEP_ID=MMETSP0852-20130820/66498_1 /ASSEMBLY_ACC=CAM_ASM_000632 /TAXON_ID=183588 /ORGANISM="Pseudo-nitzschia fraudulenta, Strain WWA7" /LENGTH=46 /DNA_ID= /DNA_START= /DNA_END= /DNA_ORIENTATION=